MPITTPDTTSTQSIYATLRNAIKSYVRPTDGVTVASLLDAEERIYIRAIPPVAVFPYITMRMLRTSDGWYNGFRETGSFEVQVVGRPESQLPLVEELADLIDACFLGYKQPGSGLIFSRSRTRQTMPQFLTPADKDVVGVLLSYDLTLWPRVLTDLRQNHH